ncbi:MAG: MATE family efflux transporter [Ruminococcaceae bacterium]|nr:MATE family efflux transporter [Oscillospiraceae bacterium]
MRTLSKAEKLILFESAPIHKAVLRLVVPTILSQLVTMIYSFADAFFVGRLGDENQIAALSLVFPLYMMTTLLGNLFGIGGNSVISRALGEADYTKARRTSAFSVYSCVGVALVFSLCLYPALNEVLYFIGASANTVGYAYDYLYVVLILGAVPTTLQLTLSHLVRAEGASRQAGFGIMLGGILNIVLDPVFMFAFNLGFKGAAIATLISNCVSLAYFIVILFKTRSESFLSCDVRNYSLHVGGEVIANGAAAAITILFGSTSNIVMTKTASAYGDIAVASFGILQKYMTMAIFVAIGIGQGIAPLLGYNYTAQNYRRIRQATRIVVGADAILAAVFFIAVESFTVFFTSLLTSDADTAYAAAEFVKIGYLGIGGTIFMNFFISAYQAYGSWKSSLLMNFVRQIVIYIPNILIMSRLWGVVGLAAAYSVSELVAFVIALIIFLRLMKRIRKELTA